MHLSSKFSFFVMLIFITPLYLNLDYILNLWLGMVPDYASLFISYLFVLVLIEVLSNSLMIGMQSTGKVKAYQMVVGFLVFLNFPIVYLVYMIYLKVELAFFVLIGMSIISLYARLVFVKCYLSFSIIRFHKRVIFRILPPVFFIAIMIFFDVNHSLKTGFMKVFLDTILFSLMTIFVIYLLGLNVRERTYLNRIIVKKLEFAKGS